MHDKLTKILLDAPLLNTQLLLCLASLTWFVILTIFPESYDKVADYSIMREIAPREVWSLAFLVHGVFAGYFLMSSRGNKVTLILEGALGALIWTTSTTACIAANLIIFKSIPPIISGELWIAGASWWFLIRKWAEEDKRLNGGPHS